jgi:hypothetical protein
MLVGAISGYWLGYSLATNKIPGENSPEFRNVLDNKENWKKKRFGIFYQIAQNIKKDISQIKDPRLRTQKEMQFKSAIALRKPSERISEYLRIVDELSNTLVGVEKIDSDGVPLWQTITLTALVLSVSALAFGLYLWITELRNRIRIRIRDIG